MSQAQSQNGTDSSTAASAGGIAAPTSSIPVTWPILNFKDQINAGDTITSHKFQHNSLPGIFWQISVQPWFNARLALRLFASWSNLKSAATVVSASFSVSLQTADADAWWEPSIDLRLPVRDFNKEKFYGMMLCDAEQRERLERYGSILVSGEIVLQLPPFQLLSRRMYESGRFSDLTIKAGEHTFSVHKAVLCEGCPAILKRVKPSSDVCLEIRSKAEAVKAMLQYLYDDPLNFAGLEDLSCEVLDLAYYFELVPLKQICEAALGDLIKRSNLVKLVILATSTSSNGLTNRTLAYAVSNIANLQLSELDGWSALKADNPLTAMLFCERLIRRLFYQECEQANPSERGPTLGSAADPFEIPVRWEIPDFQALMENTNRGDSIACKEKFRHDSMPGIAWELILYPNGRDDNSHHIALYMRPILTSGKKSQATAPFGGFALRFEPAGNATAEVTSAPPPLRSLPIQQFSLTSELGISQFAHQPLVQAHCLAENGSVVLVGNILVERPVSKGTLLVRKVFESSELADFTMQVNGESFAVHRNILYIASPAMCAMFNMPCLEAANGFVSIKETSVEAVKALLQFWYDEPLCFDGLDELAMDVYKLANRYQEVELRQVCVDALLEMVSRDNVVYLAAFATHEGCDPLEKAVSKFIIQNPDILSEEAWVQFKRPNLHAKGTIIRSIRSIELKTAGNEKKQRLAKEYREKVETELQGICGDVLSLLDSIHVPLEATPKSKMFTWMMRCEFAGYLAGIGCGEDTAKNSPPLLMQLPQHSPSGNANLGEIEASPPLPVAHATPINNLADADLAAIFQHLHPYERLIVSEVCRRWRELSQKTWLDVTTLDLTHVPFPGRNIAAIIRHCPSLQAVTAVGKPYGSTYLHSLSRLNLFSVKLYDCLSIIPDTGDVVREGYPIIFSDHLPSAAWEELVLHNLQLVLPTGLPPPPGRMTFTACFPRSLKRLQLTGSFFCEAAMSACDAESPTVLQGLDQLQELECLVLLADGCMGNMILSLSRTRLVPMLSRLANLRELYVGPAQMTVGFRADNTFLPANLPRLEVLFLHKPGVEIASNFLAGITRLTTLRILVITGHMTHLIAPIDCPARKRFPTGFGADPLPLLHVFLGKTTRAEINFAENSDALKVVQIEGRLSEFLESAEIALIFDGVWIAEKIKETAKRGVRKWDNDEY